MNENNGLVIKNERIINNAGNVYKHEVTDVHRITFREIKELRLEAKAEAEKYGVCPGLLGFAKKHGHRDTWNEETIAEAEKVLRIAAMESSADYGAMGTPQSQNIE